MKLSHPDAHIDLTTAKNGQRQITIRAQKPNLYIHRTQCKTAYPPELIQLILDIKGPGYVCDEMARDEDPTYITAHIRATLYAHIEPASLAGKRLLDFGCGSGASTMALSRLLPTTELVGVELEPNFLRIARERAAFHGAHATFMQSPSGDQLPEKIGTFDAIFLPAVYEHLLPHERQRIIPMLWACLKPNGILFIDETPWRWFPIESHTSSLPLVNYLPRALAHPFVRWCSRRGLRQDTWETLLRKGVRGASVREILRDLRRGHDGEPRLVPPQYDGMHTPIDVWYEGYARHTPGRNGAAKRLLGRMLRALFFLTRLPIVPYLSLAIQKKKS